MSQTAKSGFRNEDWVVDQFNNHHTSLYGTAWLDAMEYPHPKKVCAQTTRRMGFFNKADVLVLVDDHVEWVSVKKFTASFNQLDKRWVDDFARLWKMPDSVISSLKMYCGEDGYGPADVSGLASHTRDARRFYMDELPYDKQEQVLAFLNKNKKRIIRNVMAGRGRAAARWMLVVEERRGNAAEVGHRVHGCGDTALLYRARLHNQKRQPKAGRDYHTAQGRRRRQEDGPRCSSSSFRRRSCSTWMPPARLRTPFQYYRLNAARIIQPCCGEEISKPHMANMRRCKPQQYAAP